MTGEALHARRHRAAGLGIGLAAALALAVAGAPAQAVPARTATPATDLAVTASQPAPAVTADPVAMPPLDPAQQALADKIAAILLPPGGLQTVLQPNLDRIGSGIRNGMLNAPMRAFVRDAAIKPSQTIRIDEPTAMQAMTVLDPAFGQRQRIIGELLTTRIGDIVKANEGEMRAALARAYARRMSAAEMTQLLAFLQTPAGGSFAVAQGAVARDPAMVETNLAMMQKIDAAMPKALKDAAASTATLPRPRRYVELTETEKAVVFRLIGATPSTTPPTPRAVPPAK